MADKCAYEQLEAVREKGPCGAFIAAGFVRNRVWDALYPQVGVVPKSDVDVVYFCADKMDAAQDYAYETALAEMLPDVRWQVRNQARMHTFGGYVPFVSLEEGLLHWSETATAIGVRLTEVGAFDYVAPYGFDDLEKHILRITPPMKARDPEGFYRRIAVKRWRERWPQVTLIG